MLNTQASQEEKGQAVNVEVTNSPANLLARKNELKTKINTFLFEDKPSLFAHLGIDVNIQDKSGKTALMLVAGDYYI